MGGREVSTENDYKRATVAEAIAAWEAKGPTSLTVALMAEALYDVRSRVESLPRYAISVESVGILNGLPKHMKPTAEVVRSRDLDALFGTEVEAETWLEDEMRRTGASRGVVYEREDVR